MLDVPRREKNGVNNAGEDRTTIKQPDAVSAGSNTCISLVKRRKVSAAALRSSLARSRRPAPWQNRATQDRGNLPASCGHCMHDYTHLRQIWTWRLYCVQPVVESANEPSRSVFSPRSEQSKHAYGNRHYLTSARVADKYNDVVPSCLD